MHRGRWFWVLCIACGILLAGGGLVLATGNTALLGFQVDLVRWVDNGNGTSTWTYAVTADGDEPQGLSYWTLGLGSCYEPVEPEDDSWYWTSEDEAFGCGDEYQCEAAKCYVEYGPDPDTGIVGIKFSDCDPQLDDDTAPLPRTQVYQFTVAGVPSKLSRLAVGAKAGTEAEIGTIEGPDCAPNAVGLRSFAAASGSPVHARAGYLLMTVSLVLAGLGIVSWSQHR